MIEKIPLSALELAVVVEGGTARTAIDSSVKVAQHIEKLGYRRIWLAEHHNMEHIASSATAVLIGHVAGNTEKIRVGSGGVMLPNHTPLIVAEQFGTLETLYPGRIDLGLGRAPGTDQLTAMALRRNNMHAAFQFPDDVKELQQFLHADNVDSKVRAFPGEGLDIPIWILGSSTDSAHLAARLGLPYAFAAHFAPAQFQAAIAIYKREFRPSVQLQEPYVIACVNVIGAETDDEAAYLSSSLYRMFIGILTDTRQPLQPPNPISASAWSPEVQHAVNNMTACTFVGSKDTLRRELSAFIDHTGINELMATSYIYDLEKRLASFTILKEALQND
ncbi:LLM class flavin-dependent oxidoreductase [Olivibacter sp. XZL3]|uniref:LLM class flavin-dependent oxidoreductase n=1 Tax=Olivibacter sp. XZL3 TaxID=1735116 RepID=UPI001417049B|nr:LLM class flavin-dependent oxidoreductase [Olivibacter sp. XZL3]